MCSWMRWNCATLSSMASLSCSDRPAGLPSFADACLTFTAISTVSNRAGGWSARLAVEADVRRRRITRPSPTSARTMAQRSRRFAVNSSSCAARWGCWRRPALPSTAASSRPSTVATTTSRRASSSAARSRSRERGALHGGQLDTADRQTAAGDEPSETVLLTKTRLKGKVAKLAEEAERWPRLKRHRRLSPDKHRSPDHWPLPLDGNELARLWHGRSAEQCAECGSTPRAI